MSHEVGSAGALRLFTEPLVDEASWLLPLVLLGLPLVISQLGWQWPLSEKHLAFILWAGWLIPELIYFSFNAGLFHAYYLIMLGPPLAAMVGATVWALGRAFQRRWWLGMILTILLFGVTIGFQVITLSGSSNLVLLAAGVSALLLVSGLGILALASLLRQSWLLKTAQAVLVAAVVIAPLVWSLQTTFNPNPNAALPNAGYSDRQNTPMSSTISEEQAILLGYLLANTDPDSYLLAAPSAQEASPFILATDRPVLTFGGFSGGDDVVSVDQLAQMVSEGELRFIIGSQKLERKEDIASWLKGNCSVASIPGLEFNPPRQQFAGPPGGQALGGKGPGGNQVEVVFDCGVYQYKGE